VGDEGIVLTDREREALAGLAESIGDPWLAHQLVGQDPPRPPRPPRPRRFAGLTAALRRATAGWIGVFLLLGGAGLAVATFVHNTLVASLGLALMGVGVGRLVTDHADDVIRRWTARRAPAAGPPPPHRPPGAA
jgi:hypothetical protein